MVDIGIESLTRKQLLVLELVDKHRTYKQIAHELGISEPRVGQHVRNLKNKFGVNDLAALIDIYRDQLSPIQAPYSEPTSRFLKVPGSFYDEQTTSGNEESAFKFADSQSFEFGAEWVDDTDTRLVPEVLDGTLGTLARLLLMFGVAVIGLIILIVSLAAMTALSNVLAQPG